MKVGRYDAGGMLPGFEFEGVLIDGMRIMIDMSDMGHYICVCYGDASARCPRSSWRATECNVFSPLLGTAVSKTIIFP